MSVVSDLSCPSVYDKPTLLNVQVVSTRATFDRISYSLFSSSFYGLAAFTV